jgi:pimeloyl-ACP methyl ester carboxylesterase
VDRTDFEVPVPAGVLVGWRTGSGTPVLLIHGGPAGYEFLDSMLSEFLPGYEVASYQQRGISPPTESAPFDMETETADTAAVLDALGWDTAYIVGHSTRRLLTESRLGGAPDGVSQPPHP